VTHKPIIPLLSGAALILFSLTSCLETRGYEQSQRNECAVCHGGMMPGEGPPEFIAAPPYNLAGETERSARGNGAHEAHLLKNERARPLVCSDCHLVPKTVDAPGHMDDSYPAEIEFAWGPAWAFEAVPTWNVEEQSCQQTFCHGGYFVGGRPSGGQVPEPHWTDVSGKPAQCDGCHGQPPPAPHPEAEQCSDCHKNIDEKGDFLFPNLHVDGKVTFYLPDDD